MIEVSHLTKKYGNHTVVDDLSFTVKEGQIYGFLGPNGAGKSTTMNMLTGYIGATGGEVKIDGHDIYKEPEEAKKNIGYLPELPPLYDSMTVTEYMKFAAELKQIPKPERENKVKEAMELTGVMDMKDRLIQNLSKGYKQRVGLAQAILGSPKIIILDEPTVGLDPKQIIEIRELIKKLKKKHTVILSSHILTEVSAICDHIMIISGGKLVASDAPENLSMLRSGESSLELKVKGDSEAVKKILSNIEGTKEITAKPEEELCEVQISYQKDSDIRENVFYALAEGKMPIYEMKITEKSLEDVFLELTGSEEINDREDVK